MSQPTKVRQFKKFRCLYCNTLTQKVCKRCQQAFYCTPDHERLDWELHKNQCSDIISRMIKQERQRRKQFDMKSLQSMREEMRKCIFQNYGEGNLDVALIYCKQLQHIATQIYQLSSIDMEYSQVAADILLGSRILLKKKDFSSLQSKLNEFMANYGQMLLDMSNMPKGTGQLNDQLAEHFKRKCSIVSTVCNLYYGSGNLKKTEQVFVQYCRMFEKVFGSKSLQFSNCLFLLGVFYYEHSYYPKSVACFRNCLDIRLEAFKNTQQSICIVDCYYNLGILEKVNGNSIKAIEYIKRVIALRINIFLSLSLPVAEAQETLGAMLIEQGDYQAGVNSLLQCYSTRKKIIGKDEHPDIHNVELMIINVYKQLNAQIQKKKESKVQQQYFKKVRNILEDNVLINNKIKTNMNQTTNEKAFSKDIEDIREEVRQSEDSDQPQEQFIIKIQGIVEHFTPYQLKLLSELQITNSQKITQFERIKNINDSRFMESLSDQQLHLLKRQNERIFIQIASQQIRNLELES